MIEVTCGACGSTNRFAEADVPAGGKTVACTRCKARVAIPARAMPSIPAPGVSGGTGDVIDLADLPAPKRASPLAGAPAGARPIAPGTKLPPLPVPPSPTIKGAPGLPPRIPPAPAAAPPPIDMSPLEMDSIDLPAPVGPSSRGITDLPAPVGPSSRGITDLPAPVGPSPRAHTASPALRQGSLDAGFGNAISLDDDLDLPAPKRASGGLDGGLDLPAPKRASGGLDGGLDLPAPKRASGGLDGGLDLPAPKRASGGLDGGLDLPAPKRASGGLDGGLDLPAPKRASGGLDDDLDLLAPKRATQAPAAPGGFGGFGGFDDSLDLLAPEGASSSSDVDLPAPKGFFDDLPAPKSATPAGSVDLPAPKGFFDDLPAPKSATPSGSVDLPAPLGFFDDLPGPRGAGATPAAGAKPKSLDLDDFDLAPPTLPPQSRAASAPPPASRPSAVPLELDGGPGNVPALELDSPSDRYNSLDLPSVSPPGTEPAKAAAAAAAAAGVVSFKPGQVGAVDAASVHAPRPDSLDLDVDDTHKAKPRPTIRATAERAKVDSAGKAKARPPGRTRKLALIGVLVVAVVGGGGFFFYQRWQAGQDRAAQRDSNLAAARKALASDAARHWQNAAQAAERALAVDSGNGEALGIAVQGHLAGLLDEGTNEKQRLADAEALVEKIRASSAGGAQVDKALALSGIVTDDVDGAIAKLTELTAASPKDADAFLYLGWAHAAARQWKPAIAAYEQAATSKLRAVPATYGIGLAHLALGDLEAARKSFATVNDLAKKGHLGAQVGMAAAMPATEYARRETELLAVLALDGIDKADARVVARAWTLAGDDARRAGRLDAARDRYRKALALRPDEIAAIVGDAEIALAENRLDAADTGLTRALALSPDDPAVNLAAADLDVRRGKLTEAGVRLTQLKAAALANPTDRTRVHLLDARRLEAAKQDDQAVLAYEAAQLAAGDADITPTVAEAALLTKMAAKARADKNPDRDRQLTAKARGLLETLEARAAGDAGTALTLGRAYLAAGDGGRAETWLEAALLSRPDDVEAHFQLAEALSLQGKKDAAVEILLKGFNLDTSRVDVGLELARTLEDASRNTDAASLYGKLLGGTQVTVELRMRAGLFYARTGDAKAAAKQGDEITKLEPTNPAGLYLRAEGLYAEGKADAGNYEEARKLYKQASDLDPQALYLDGLGRAAEMAGLVVGERRYKDEALAAYKRAQDADPNMLNPPLGQGRIHLELRAWKQALVSFEDARKIDPKNADIPFGFGVAYQESGDAAKAIEWLTRAAQLRPRADIYYRLGILYHNAEKIGAAASAYRKATELALDEERGGAGTVAWLTDILFTLGQLDDIGGNESGSCAAYQRYLSRNPPDRVKITEVKTAMMRLRCR